MKKSTTLIAAAAVGIAAIGLSAGSLHAAINSNLLIEKGQSFLLGGSQPSAFRVRGTNSGPVAVQVLARSEGKDTAIATIKAGGTVDQSFAKGEIAVLRNTSRSQDARMKLRVTGYTSGLGMRYEGVQ